jgi:hypothetical protein
MLKTVKYNVSALDKKRKDLIRKYQKLEKELNTN